ncbi:MAG: trigger factor [Bacteroidales bacterium]|nr:trigger factor [Bacteroidales bacterium]
MNIIKEATGELAATLKVQFTEADYSEDVNKVLKDHQKKAAMPGFRPGKVPFGHIKRMYGKAVVLDTVNKLISDSLENYIRDNQLNLLGYPIPNTDKNHTMDFDTQTEFEFIFDIGLAPEVNISIDKSISQEYYKIIAEDDIVEKHIEDICRKFGAEEPAEVSAENDLLYGTIMQLDENEMPKEDGHIHSGYIFFTNMKDEEEKKRFIGIKKEEKIIFDPIKLAGDAETAARILGMKKEDAENIQGKYSFEVTAITHVIPATIDGELFEKVFPGAGISDEASFRTKISEEASMSVQPTADQVFLTRVAEQLTELAAITLPDDFLKRWIYENNEGKLSMEEIENDYATKYARSTRWELIEGKIIAENNIRIEQIDIRNYIQDSIVSQYFPFLRGNEEMDPRINQLIDRIMKNQDEVRKAYSTLADIRLVQLFKEKLNIIEKEATFNEFVEIVKKTHPESVNDSE